MSSREFQKFPRIIHLGISLIILTIILSGIAIFVKERLLLISISMFVYGFGIGMCNGLVMRTLISSKAYVANYAMSLMIFLQMLIMMIGLEMFNEIVSHFNYSLDCFSAVNVGFGIIISLLLTIFAHNHRHKAWE